MATIPSDYHGTWIGMAQKPDRSDNDVKITLGEYGGTGTEDLPRAHYDGEYALFGIRPEYVTLDYATDQTDKHKATFWRVTLKLVQPDEADASYVPADVNGNGSSKRGERWSVRLRRVAC